MDDIAAVVRGLRHAGVAEIVVLDGHGSGAVIPHRMAPGAKYITGKLITKEGEIPDALHILDL